MGKKQILSLVRAHAEASVEMEPELARTVSLQTNLEMVEALGGSDQDIDATSMEDLKERDECFVCVQSSEPQA